MKAVTIEHDAGAAALRADLQDPVPAEGEVLVRVRASSVNPIDGAVASGMLRPYAEHIYPITLGRDFAGTVEAVGAGVVSFAVGDEVFGMVPAMRPDIRAGAWAQRIVVSPANTTRRPDAVGVEVAGAVGMAAATAIPAIEAVALEPGQTVLIAGAPGGVGTIAVQLLAASGVTIIAPALPEDVDYLHALGVTDVVAREGDQVAAVRQRYPDGVDAVIDLVSYAPGAYDGALAQGGRVASALNAAGEGPGRIDVHNNASAETFGRIAQLLADGSLSLPITATYDLDHALTAIADLGAKHTRGKLAVSVT